MDEVGRLQPEPSVLPIALLLGGDSAERSISLLSGAAVAQALLETGRRVVQIDPSQQPVEAVDWSQFSLAFLALHGTYGEDGQLQRQLDRLRVRYTCSGAQASELAFKKIAAKVRFLAAGLPTPEYRLLPSGGDPDEAADRARELGYPLVVKPEAQGSSLGVTIVTGPEDLVAAIRLARQFGGDVLLERAIPGEEWTVPILDERPLPPIRIQTPHPFFDFSAKYEDAQTRCDVIMDEGNLRAREVQGLALQACAVLGCRGLSRVDIRVDLDGRPWLLEVNTIPGLTPQSLVPKSARALGWSMLRLCEAMIDSALRAA